MLACILLDSVEVDGEEQKSRQGVFKDFKFCLSDSAELAFVWTSPGSPGGQYTAMQSQVVWMEESFQEQIQCVQQCRRVLKVALPPCQKNTVGKPTDISTNEMEAYERAKKHATRMLERFPWAVMRRRWDTEADLGPELI